jgi:hypothetical protein
MATESQFTFPLTSVGEHLTAELINHLGKSFWGLCMPVPPNIEQVAEDKPIAFPDVRLLDYCGLNFDPMHRVDIAVRVAPKCCIPFEVKLGTNLTHGNIREKLGCPCSKSDHPDPRWKGDMMAVLARNFDIEATLTDELRIELGGEPVVLEKQWYLLSRRDILKRLSRFRLPMGFVSFEDIAERIGREEFNQLVQRHLPDDFFRSWVECPDRE